MDMTSSARELLRHTLATVAYRGGKTLRDAPESFANYKAEESIPDSGANCGSYG